MPHKRFQTCHAHGVIDAEIAEKGHLWTETSLIPKYVRHQFIDVINSPRRPWPGPKPLKRRQGTGGAVTHSEVFFDLGHQGRVDHPRREVQREDGRQQQDRADTADERPPVLRVPMAGCCLIGVFFHGWKRCFLFRTRAHSRSRRLIPLTPYRIRRCFSRVTKAPKFHITQPYLFQ